MSSTVKIGIIGCGAISQQYHVPSFKHLTNVEVLAVSDKRFETAQNVTRMLGLSDDKIYTNAEDLLKIDEIDGVLILTPNSTHLDLVKLAAAYKKHVFIQKPMARNVAEAKEMIAACEAANVKLFASFMHRYLPEVQAALTYIKEGYIGKVEVARMRNAPGSTSTLSKWFYNKELVGGGAVLDIGVHGIDITRYLIGDIKEVLFAQVDTLKAKVVLKDEVIVPTNEDHAIAIYQTDNGCLVTHEISWNHRSPVDRFSMELYGSEGSILLRGAMGPLAIMSEKFGEDKSWVVPELPYTPFGYTQHQSFIDMIANGTAPNPSGYDGLRGIEIAEEIYRVAKG